MSISIAILVSLRVDPIFPWEIDHASARKLHLGKILFKRQTIARFFENIAPLIGMFY